MGLGTVGLKRDNNVIVDATIERMFARDGNCRNNEKRWYYYGTDVYSAQELEARPVPGFSTPRKRRATDDGNAMDES
jgi:hypothetical protein